MPPIDQEAWDRAAKNTPGERSKYVGRGVLPVTEQSNCTRMWDLSGTDIDEDRIQLLRQYADAKNYEAGNKTTVIHEPEVGRETLPGYWVASNVRGAKRGEAKGIYEDLSRVYNIDEVSDLADLEYIKTVDEDILRAFGLRDGEGRAIVCVWPNINPDSTSTETYLMDTLRDIDLVTNFADSTYKYVGRQFKRPGEESATAQFRVAFQKRQWRRWTPTAAWAAESDYNERDQVTQGGAYYDCIVAHTAGTFADDLASAYWRLTRDPENIEYGNEPRDGATRTRTWSGFDKADLVVIRDALKEDDGGIGNEANFHVTGIQITDNQDGSLTFVQSQIKKVEEASGADADGNLGGMKKKDPHGFQPGTFNTFASIYRNFSEAELTALTDTAPTGYVHISTDPDIQSSGLFTRVYRYEKIVWLAWGHDAYAHDFIRGYSNARGTGDEADGSKRDQFGKVWYGIRRADVDLAAQDCRKGTNTPPETNYVIIGVNISDNHDGSVTVEQVQRRRVEEDQAGAEVMKAHGIWTGLMNRIVTLYDDFLAKDLPDGDVIDLADPDDNDYHVVSNVPRIKGNGLWQRIVVSEYPQWTKDWEDKILMSQRNAGGYAKTEQRVVEGVDEDDRDTVFAAAQSPDDATTQVVTGVTLREGANGERKIAQDTARVYTGVTDDDAEVIDISPAVGSRPAQMTRVWRRRTLAARNTLKAAASIARSSYTHESIAYSHYRLIETDHGDGAYTLTQVLRVAGSSSTVIGGAFYTDRVTLIYADTRTIRTSASQLYSEAAYAVWGKLFNSASAAWAFADNSTTHYDENGTAVRDSYVKEVDGEMYLGVQAIWDAVDLSVIPAAVT